MATWLGGGRVGTGTLVVQQQSLQQYHDVTRLVIAQKLEIVIIIIITTTSTATTTVSTSLLYPNY